MILKDGSSTPAKMDGRSIRLYGVSIHHERPCETPVGTRPASHSAPSSSTPRATARNARSNTTGRFKLRAKHPNYLPT
jgi:hypothetical protein